MKITTIPLGSYQTNCYILVDEATKKAVVIDPGFYTQALLDAIEQSGASEIDYILLTHGHWDHVLGAQQLREKTNAKIAIHPDDISLLQFFIHEYQKENGLPKEDLSIDILLKDGDEISFGNTTLKVMHVPGHTKGGVAFSSDNDMFVGDTVFRGTIGRTDLEGGDYHTMMMSIRKLAKLKEDYTLYPGHGETTTMNEERRYNRYFQESQEEKYAKPKDNSVC